MRSPPAVIALAIALLCSGAPVCRATTDYLIVTTEALAPAFQELADARAGQGLVPEVATVEAIAAVPGRDLPEKIRTYIQSEFSMGSLRFVLIGGDVGQVPARVAFNDYYFAGDPEVTTDLYYAALDGDWDGDGDGVFCEVGVDLADLDPEIAIGRAPVNTILEAELFVTKTLAYEDPANDGHRESVLYLAEVMFPDDWVPGQPGLNDAAPVCQAIWQVILGSPVPYVHTRLYENYPAYPGSLPLNSVEAISGLGSGDYGVVFHVGRGWADWMSVGDGSIDAADASGLSNSPDYFLLVTEVPAAAAFQHDAILEDFILSPTGGAVATIGWSHVSFPANAQTVLEELSQELFVDGSGGVGEALQKMRNDRASSTAENTVWRLNQLAVTLLGDPVLRVGPVEPATSAPESERIRAMSVTPNPFNPLVRIHFDLLAGMDAPLAARVDVFDVRGRHVRSLFDGELPPGRQTIPWDGRADSGASLASGVYLVVVESGTTRLISKAVLLK